MRLLYAVSMMVELLLLVNCRVIFNAVCEGKGLLILFIVSTLAKLVRLTVRVLVLELNEVVPGDTLVLGVSGYEG